MWLPDVITSTPAANRALAVDSVRPIPPARFSPLAVTKSIPRAPRRSGRSASTARRPGLPITSPIIRIRQAPAGRGASPLAGLPRRTTPVGGASGIADSVLDRRRAWTGTARLPAYAARAAGRARRAWCMPSTNSDGALVPSDGPRGPFGTHLRRIIGRRSTWDTCRFADDPSASPEQPTNAHSPSRRHPPPHPHDPDDVGSDRCCRGESHPCPGAALDKAATRHADIAPEGRSSSGPLDGDVQRLSDGRLRHPEDRPMVRGSKLADDAQPDQWHERHELCRPGGAHGLRSCPRDPAVLRAWCRPARL